MNLAVEPTGAAVTGRYFDGCQAQAHRAAYDPTIRSTLHAATSEIPTLSFELIQLTAFPGGA